MHKTKKHEFWHRIKDTLANGQNVTNKIYKHELIGKILKKKSLPCALHEAHGKDVISPCAKNLAHGEVAAPSGLGTAPDGRQRLPCAQRGTRRTAPFAVCYTSTHGKYN